MPANAHPDPRNLASQPANRYGIAALLALSLVCCIVLFAADGPMLWAPHLGVGLTAAIWLGRRFVYCVAGFFLGVGFAGAIVVSNSEAGNADPILWAASAVISAGAIAAAWAIYLLKARGSPELNDPRSAVLFLLLVPGLVAGAAAIVTAVVRLLASSKIEESPIRIFGESWLANMLGFLVVTPFLLVHFTPILQQVSLLPRPKGATFAAPIWTFGESLELAGLALGNCLLSLIQVHLHLRIGNAAWPLWGISLLLVVWSSIRQGLRGGTATAFAGSASALVWASGLGVGPMEFNPLQGNLLAQCSVALLVGSSLSWIRSTEARYRHVVGHIPLVLTSVRLSRGFTFAPDGVPLRASSQSRPELKGGSHLIETAEIILVSHASKSVVGVDADDLIGPFRLWLDVVHPKDQDLVVASISQLALQRQTIHCEYRVAPHLIPAGSNGEAAHEQLRWVRDTLSPHYTDDGLLDGWDGVVEEITDQRALQQESRRTTGMLQALIANMPTGVFFVQGPTGQPILVNARARQLLGQREDMSAGLSHLSQVYRLHKSDGTAYPVDDLPVVKALRYGQTCTANDIVVHRPDGRRIPLFTWAAPIDLGTVGRPEGAVWVLEDLTAIQQAEGARRESEARLRAVFETLAEGVIVQDKAGVVIEGNPAAANILGITVDKIVGRKWLGPDFGCLRDPGVPCPPDQHPDRLALQIKLPVRNVVLGLPRSTGETRWVVVNSMPLPVGTAFIPNTKGAQLVTTFADITAERHAQRVVLTSKEKFQSLVEHLPVAVLQLDPIGRVDFVNPAGREFFGSAAGDLPKFEAFAGLFESGDRPRVAIAVQEIAYGKESRFEFRAVTQTGEKTGLAIVQPLRHDTAIVGSTWIVVDTTHTRRLEDELMRSQGIEFVARLASAKIRDFNDMVCDIVGAMKDLKAANGAPDAGAHFETIERSTTTATRLLEEIDRLRKIAPDLPEKK